MRMEDHYEHSHGYASTFVSNVPLNDFKELFKIIRTVNPSPAEVAQLRMAQERPAYYRVQRLPKIKIPLVSAQSSGE